MKKKVFAIFTALALLSLSACGGTDQGNTDTNVGSSSEALSSVEDVANPEEENQFVELEIKESGYSTTSGFLFYSVDLYNPNPDLAVEFPTIRVTARDSEGILLGTEDQTLSIIYPEQDFWYCGQAFEVAEAPATVEFEVVPPDDYNIVNVSTLEHPEYVPLTVENVAQRGDRFVGEVRNDNDYDIDTCGVFVIFRDDSGKLLGGEFTFIDSVSASGTAPFDMGVYADFVTPNFEVYANIW